MMTEFFEGFQYLCEEILFAPYNTLRAMEVNNWFAANGINWLFMAIGSVAFLYWMKELQKFNDHGEENRDPIAHSFLANGKRR